MDAKKAQSYRRIMQEPVAETYLGRAGLILGELNGWFSPLLGRWRTTGWWNAAAILAAIIRFHGISGDESCLDLLPLVHTRRWLRKPRKFTNRYYDDEGWWALAWMEAHSATGEGRYLETARGLFDDLRGGWSETCGGGILWRRGSRYKAAIANSLYTCVAAGLHAATGREGYREEAGRAWRWLEESGLIGGDGLVRDGLGGDCGVNHDVWTYNQGMLIGAAVRLAGAGISPEGSRQPLDVAGSVALAAIGRLSSPAGILREAGEPGLDRDRVQFKGILMRYLADLWSATAEEKLASFILANADSLWRRARREGTGLVGSSWEGPFDRADAGRQGSALDAMTAAAVAAKGAQSTS